MEDLWSLLVWIPSLPKSNGSWDINLQRHHALHLHRLEYRRVPLPNTFHWEHLLGIRMLTPADFLLAVKRMSVSILNLCLGAVCTINLAMTLRVTTLVSTHRHQSVAVQFLIIIMVLILMVLLVILMVLLVINLGHLDHQTLDLHLETLVVGVALIFTMVNAPTALTTIALPMMRIITTSTSPSGHNRLRLQCGIRFRIPSGA